MPGHRDARVGRLIAATCTILAVAAALAGCGGDEDTSTLNGFTRTPPARVADVGLPDVAPGAGGRTMPFRAARGGLLLAYFGYTYCPDICPTTLADVRRALEVLPAAERRRVAVAMTTVDPGRDTRKVLNGYLSHFLPSWHALRTTDPDALRRAESAFGVRHEIGPTDKHGDYDVSHTAVLYAVDDRGVVRVEWPFGTSSNAIAADLRTLLAEQRPTPA
jgi:protein SCO1/2